MDNPFKSIPNESKTSSTSNLSALEIKPIKSLNSNATGSGRTKVELRPGHSLMDWIRLTNSGKDLTCNSFGKRKVTGIELAQHNRLDDAWTSIEGNVFNITPYLNFHPGGVDELMRAAGKESTKLFKQIHAWVNWNSMLQKCRIGYLIPDDDVQFAELDKIETNKQINNKNDQKLDFKSTNINVPLVINDELFDKNLVVLNETDSFYDLNISDKKYHLDKPIIALNGTLNNELITAYWQESMNEFYLHFEFKNENGLKEENLMIDLTEARMMKVKIYLAAKMCFVFDSRLPDTVKQEINFRFEKNRSLIITLVKLKEELWAGQLHSECYRFELINQTSQSKY